MENSCRICSKKTKYEGIVKEIKKTDKEAFLSVIGLIFRHYYPTPTLPNPTLLYDNKKLKLYFFFSHTPTTTTTKKKQIFTHCDKKHSRPLLLASFLVTDF